LGQNNKVKKKKKTPNHQEISKIGTNNNPFKKLATGWIWWYTSNPSTRRLRQEDQEFEANLDYIRRQDGAGHW
jgi:hypothetical protein